LLKRGLVEPIGLVSSLNQFKHLKPATWEDMVVGGHEIRGISLLDEALRLSREFRAFDPRLVEQCGDELAQIDARIRPGTILNVGQTIAEMADEDVPVDQSPRKAIERLRADMDHFAKDAGLEHVVVVNVSSTEPLADVERIPKSWAELEPMLDDAAECPLPASSLYAIAALGGGHSYINFTPSLGAKPEAIGELAKLNGTRHAGCDGKTGETLLKSVLAPMFARRNLNVMSWVGHNIFGNLDGKVLDDPKNKETKVSSKDRLLGEILPEQPQTHVSIEYIESLGDWKTAWDHIHFTGFLGTPMAMQVTWQGCDSILAAPLVLDLVRFTDIARRRGETGLLTFLASFFKSPLGVEEHCFDRQFQALEEWAGE